MQKEVLIVEDEPAIREMVGVALKSDGFLLREAADASEAQTIIRDHTPDLILLDWMLPGTSGLQLAKELRDDEPTRHVPIIMLTARSEEHSRVRGLEAGVDDYVTKPFSVRELRLRIKAVLRRAQPESEGTRIELGGLVIDEASHRVFATGREVLLGPMEYRTLHFFMTHAERVYTRRQLMDRIWGQDAYLEERTVDVHIRRLRKALLPYRCDGLVQTVRGTGYRFSTM
ncbi:MAG: phosphate regulon transcriptional regulator PhoB [Gammaproteobacteria bacterium]|nr:phosphate regulon transcriptional regulator PhoB [Gammaproteobacteria bacterium]